MNSRVVTGCPGPGAELLDMPIPHVYPGLCASQGGFIQIKSWGPLCSPLRATRWGERAQALGWGQLGLDPTSPCKQLISLMLRLFSEPYFSSAVKWDPGLHKDPENLCGVPLGCQHTAGSATS